MRLRLIEEQETTVYLTLLYYTNGIGKNAHTQTHIHTQCTRSANKWPATVIH